MRQLKVILVVLLLATFFKSSGQIIRSELMRRIDVGEEMMLGGSYDSAEVEFTVVLRNLTPLPSRMAYFYGRNSYHIGEYKRAINWLNKYIQLKGARGIYYEESVQYLQLAEQEYIKERTAQAIDASDELASNDFDCGGMDKMLCPVCRGTGVVIVEGRFDNIYKTCPYSLGEGYLSCEEYNLFMKGNLEPKITE